MKYKQYQKMKDSGVEWIGEIPEHWKVSKLKFVTKCLDGQRIPLNGEERKEREGSYPYYGASGIVDYIDDYIFDEKLVCFSEDGENLRSRELPISFIIEGKTWVNNHAHVLKPIKYDHYFLAYFLDSIDVTPFLEGATRSKLNQDNMNNIFLTKPPLDEAVQISQYLQKEISNFADLISKSQSQVNLLQEKRQALINHTVTKGLDPNVPMKDSGIEWIGEIPEHWEVRPLQMVASVLDPFPSHRAPPIVDDGFPYPGIGDLDKNGNLIGSCRTVSETALKEQESRFKIDLGDLAFARVATLGKIIHLRNDFRYCLSPTMAVLKPKINSLYLSYTLEAQYFQEQLTIVSTGSTRYAVGIMTLRKLKVVLPPKEEQKQIDNFLQKETTQLDDLISKSQSQVNLLQEKRQALITAAVTGKIDVRNGIA